MAVINSGYPKEAIDVLTELVKGKKENAKLLASSGYPELALVYDAVNGNKEIIGLLQQKKFLILAAFLTSILTDNRTVIGFMISRKAPQWAATANLINKDNNAKQWLLKFHYGHFVNLAEAIVKRMDDNEGSGLEFLYKSPFH